MAGVGVGAGAGVPYEPHGKVAWSLGGLELTYPSTSPLKVLKTTCEAKNASKLRESPASRASAPPDVETALVPVHSELAGSRVQKRTPQLQLPLLYKPWPRLSSSPLSERPQPVPNPCRPLTFKQGLGFRVLGF